MTDKNNNNEYPDLTGLFDIDSDSLPEELIPKSSDSKGVRTPFLTANDPKTLSKSEQKAIEKQKKTETRKKKINKFRTGLIIALAAALIIVTAFESISFFVADSKKPVITAEKPVEQTISRYHNAKAVSVTIGNRMTVVFIDNDYDVHYIEKGQPVEITDDKGNIINGTVSDIKEQAPDTAYLKEYNSLLTETEPSTAVYAVFVTPENTDIIKKDGMPLSVKVITKTAADALTVNSSAVQYSGNQPFLWIYSPLKKTIHRQDVRLGLSVDGVTEISAGIKKNDRIVTSFSCAPEALYDGIKVKTD